MKASIGRTLFVVAVYLVTYYAVQWMGLSTDATYFAAFLAGTIAGGISESMK